MAVTTAQAMRIQVKTWLALRDSIPTDIDAIVDRETAKAIHIVEGHAVAQDAIRCCRCGQELTNEVSRFVGIGPICAGHWGIPWTKTNATQEELEALRQRVHAVTVRDLWLPRSAIEAELVGPVQVESPDVEPTSQIVRPTHGAFMESDHIRIRCNYGDNAWVKSIAPCTFDRETTSWKFTKDAETAAGILVVALDHSMYVDDAVRALAMGTVGQGETPAPAYDVVLQDGFLYFRCDRGRNPEARKVLGYRWNKDFTCWQYPASPISAQALIALVGDDKAAPEVHALVQVQAEADAIKGSNDLPDHPSKTSSWNHQRQAYEFLRNLPAGMLAMEMGTGKSKVAVDLITNRGHRRTLIIAPKSTIRNVWPGQFRTHCHVGDLEVVVVDGTPKRKVRLMEEGLRADHPVVFVMSYETCWRSPLGPTYEQYQGEDGHTKTRMTDRGLLLSNRWDCVVLDESHRIKAPGSNVSQFCHNLGKNAAYRLAMTGTPLADKPLDIYAQYRFLDANVFGTSFAKFREHYAIMSGYGGYEVEGYRNQEEMADRMYSIGFRVRSADVLDLPPVKHQIIRCELSARARRIYDQMEQEMLVDFGNGTGISANLPITRLLRCQQITSGHLPVADDLDIDGSPTHTEIIDTAKADSLADTLEDIPTQEPVVVFCRFRPDMDAVRRVAEGQGRRVAELSGQRDDLAAWQAGQYDLIVVQIKSGGAGIDLTRSHYGFYFSQTFSLTDYDQSLKRMDRPGQTHPVTFYHIVAENTVDEDIYLALDSKKSDIRGIQESIRGRLGRDVGHADPDA